ncbi:MAG TPA: hypothetical protein VMW45_04655, partial [Dehalococcoidia bacterium]|nr:hypothetical protein [Dehalococcoidia bacterium]
WVEKYPMPVMGTAEGFGTKSVTVKLKDGKEFSKEVTIAKGMPQNPLTPEEFNSKYRDCASTVLSEEEVEKSLSLLSNLPEVKNIKELMEIIAKTPSKGEE